MNKLPKSILNYFATFTETRFNFRTLINYQWTDDELTLDLGIFPELQSLLAKNISAGNQKEIVIKKGEYVILLKDSLITSEITKAFTNEYSIKYLKSCVQDERNKDSNKDNVLIASRETGEISKKTLSQKEKEKLAQIILRNGYRQFNLAIRKKLEDILISLHEESINQLKEDRRFHSAPASSFNSFDLTQSVFDDLQQLASKANSEEVYFNKVKDYFINKKWNVVLYDLFYILTKFKSFTIIGTLYLFFLELKTKEEGQSKKYPLYFHEIELKFEEDSITFKYPRKLLMINTPVVNSCKFPSILTTPRASLFANTADYLKAMETFIQAHYGRSEPFILENNFRRLVSNKKNYPNISFRIGLQIIKNENKKILDYSELLALIELGGGKKFTNFINNYIKGNVEDTTDQVYDEFAKLYPPKTPKRYISDNPLPLNLQQKRIITAASNPKNKIIVIDGPPGTGKSHTIAAFIYWANQKSKSVVITSHKKQALDVIEQLLTDKFKKLHPQAKPSVIRFVKGEENKLNLPDNALSGPAISSATNRFHQFNQPALEKDKIEYLKLLESVFEKKLTDGKEYKNKINKLISFEKLKTELVEKNVISEQDVATLARCQSKENHNFELLELASNKSLFLELNGISLNQLKILFNKKTDLPKIKETCDNLNQIKQDNLSYKPKTKTIPNELIEFINRANLVFKSDLPLITLDSGSDSLARPKNPLLKLFSSIVKDKSKQKEAKELLIEIKSLKYDTILSDISYLIETSREDLSIGQIKNNLKELCQLISAQKEIELITSFKKEIGLENKDLKSLYLFIDNLTEAMEKMTPELIQALAMVQTNYSSLLKIIEISFENLSSLAKISEFDTKKQMFWDLIKLHAELTTLISAKDLHSIDSNRINQIVQKLTENKNDQRLKNLKNYNRDIQKALSSISAGIRLSQQEANMILQNISCVISSPELISRHFPMKEDMIDFLVIDEASQVSIAESISLILRAKQVIIFGDELQYGAVGAVNVNSTYSKSYFKEIIESYSEDYHDPVSDGTAQSILKDVSKEMIEEDQEVEQILSPKSEATQIWLKTFDIRTSTLNFCRAISNYCDSLTTHFRSFNEIIDYSNEFFYKPNQMPLVVNRICTKPIKKVLRFIKVKTKGNSGSNVNLDEIEIIMEDMQNQIKSGFKGTIGIITSFREQTARTEEILHREFKNYHKLKKDHKLAIWFVGDVQGEERDIVYYSFVEDKNIGNADLRTIYPVIGGTADNIRRLKMQRLNVGFSRAKDTMVFVHSMSISDYAKTRLGDALKYYQKIFEEAKDDIIVDIEKLESPAEKDLYQLMIQTKFVKENKDSVKIVPQFKIGKYIKEEFHGNIPKYRVDFLLTLSDGGREKALIMEYDGIEYHTKNPDIVTADNITQEYLDYDINRQIELESYGYRFLRINKFTLIPEQKDETKVDVLNKLLENSFKQLKK